MAHFGGILCVMPALVPVFVGYASKVDELVDIMKLKEAV